MLQARIEALGGQILYWNGVRVMGVLAVSRAVGDHCLRPYVIAQPEVPPSLESDTRQQLLLQSVVSTARSCACQRAAPRMLTSSVTSPSTLGRSTQALSTGQVDVLVVS